MTDAQIKHMAEQFLRWKLPPNFSPDGGITFEKLANVGTQYESTREPVGTNLFDYTQADAMVRHMLDGLPQAILVTVDGDVLRDQEGNVVGTVAKATT